MAAATACASTALAGQSLLRQSNELARNANFGEARVTMRKSASKSAASGSIWYVLSVCIDVSHLELILLCLAECGILSLLLYNVLGVSKSFLCFWLNNCRDHGGRQCELVRNPSDPHCDVCYSYMRS